MDLTDFWREKVSAWAAGLRFSHEFHDKIAKVAIAGDRSWAEYLTRVCAPFYARQARYFDSAVEAWTWHDD